jgi:hypothetical protein
MTAKISKNKKMKPRDYCADQPRWDKAKRIAYILEKNTKDTTWSASRVLREITDMLSIDKKTDAYRTVRDFFIN